MSDIDTEGYKEISNDNGVDIRTLGEPDDNVIQPFQLESTNLRGRVVRLGSQLDDILSAHNYPDEVAYLVAQTVTLSLLLSSMLKYEGIFTLQTKGDGPVNMLVADVTSGGDIRGCANYDAERLDHMREHQKNLRILKDTSHSHIDCLGAGYIAFTVDQGDFSERYQGIVELKGVDLAACVKHYFAQSEQILTALKVAVDRDQDGKWRGGGIMLQKMPDEDDEADLTRKEAQENWERGRILMESVKDEELLDQGLHSNMLLHRLFHEEGVMVFTPHNVQKNCRCDAGRVESILLQMPKDDRDYMVQDGKITMTCDFCAKSYSFDPKDIDDKITS